MGQQREGDADVLFASIQTLGRAAHLERFPRDVFATPTPEHTDGGDLLALCEEKLVYRCDLVEGVKQDPIIPMATECAPRTG